MIQWAATVSSGYIQSYLPDPIAFAFLVHGFPIIGLSVSFFIQFRNAKRVWDRITNPNYLSYRVDKRITIILTICVMLIGAFYLTYVPFQTTGLFAILTNPTESAMARENSLKLLDSTLVKYSYSFMIFIFAPLLSVLMAISLFQSLIKRRILKSLFVALVMASVLFLVSLTGERSHPVFIIVTIFFAFFLNQGLPINRYYMTLVGIASIVILTVPTLLTILREGKSINIVIFWEYLVNGIFGRVFYGPMETALHYVHYAQTQHFFGLAAIPKLAILLGIEPIDVPNFIGLTYEFSGIQSVSANACYVLTYYSYFGLASLFLSLVGLWLLDFAVWIYRRLSDKLLLPCVASVSTISIYFISSDYTSILLTNGFGVILILACALDSLFINTKKPYAKPSLTLEDKGAV
jgi:hypothetical protein